MKVAGKRHLRIPPDLANESQAAAEVIRPKARLFFNVKLLGVK